MLVYEKLAGGFKYVFMFTPKIGEDEPNVDLRIFVQRGWNFNHQLER